MISATIFTAILSFVSTNIDDLFVLMLLFVRETQPARKRQVMYGQYLGIGFLTAVSLFGAGILQFIPQGYIGFAGLVPIGLGIREIISWLKEKNQENGMDDEVLPEEKGKGLVLTVMLLAIADGADNLGVYIPLFAGFSKGQMAVVLLVFAVMVLLWCLLAERFVSWPALGNLLRKHRHVIVPVVFIGLGIYILTENLFR